ncbi:MAG: ABC transporter ATP-binding protein [Proteobacteria bacterium]|nr:ABC transporter ATP-binding protein [Pseudomonadota bacterium]
MPYALSSMPSSSDDTIWALRDVSFEVNQGEVIGIIGRNGAGKSTLLKILSRITEPTSGDVKLYGRVSSLLEVGTGFHPELTGRENIYLNGAILGMRKTEIARKFDEIVEFAEIEKFMDTPVKRYSSGMYVRLAFAVAAHLEPEILLVDEVLAVGDIPFQKKCLGKMSDVAKGGRTVLFVSHNMQAIQKLCTRVIILHEGRVVMDGPTDEATSKYLGDGMGLNGEQIWPDINNAPGDNVVRMHAVRVLDQNGKVCANYDVRDPVSIEVEYWVLEERHRLTLQLYFINEMGHVLFISKDNLDSPWRDNVCPIGHFRTTCHIPGDFLNEGLISITYGIDTIDVSHLNHATGRDVVIFKVSDRMDPGGVRGNFPLQWRHDGVRPRLFWAVEKTT